MHSKECSFQLVRECLLTNTLTTLDDAYARIAKHQRLNPKDTENATYTVQMHGDRFAVYIATPIGRGADVQEFLRIIEEYRGLDDDRTSYRLEPLGL